LVQFLVKEVVMAAKVKVLIAYDGSDCAEAALDDLQRAGLPKAVEALVMSVSEVWLPPPPPSSFEILELAQAVYVPADLTRVYAQGSPALEEGQALADRAAARLRTNFPSWVITTQASVGSPTRELVRQADGWKPDLIVVGSHGRSTVGRLVLGSVSQGVLTHARCSVRVARGRVEEPGTPVRIFIGVDGSRASATAVGEVASRTWPAMSEVRLIAVNDPLTATFVGKFIPTVRKAINEANQADRTWLNKILERSCDQLRSSGLKVRSEILEGDPKQLLIATAGAWGADCIFVGSLGFSNRFERFLLGSVSAAVAARAHCSVEVVRSRKIFGGNNERQFDYTRN
jgi:nucleotide-binding universal stress UspA family protein